jgi:hypothetical protein
LIGSALMLLMCTAYWFSEKPRALAQTSTEILDANGNKVSAAT